MRGVDREPVERTSGTLVEVPDVPADWSLRHNLRGPAGRPTGNPDDPLQQEQRVGVHPGADGEVVPGGQRGQLGEDRG